MKKRIVWLLLLGLVPTIPALAQQGAGEKRSIASEMRQRLASAQRQVVSLVEAMPENKMSFVPSQGEFKGVRDFSGQAKHIGSISYMVCSAISGEPAPEGMAGEDGPASVKSKAQVVSYLNDAVAFCNKAYDTINESNAVETVKGPFGPSTRVGLAALNSAHVMDHYGQMVVYLRMNGIVPPASRPQR